MERFVQVGSWIPNENRLTIYIRGEKYVYDIYPAAKKRFETLLQFNHNTAINFIKDTNNAKPISTPKKPEAEE